MIQLTVIFDRDMYAGDAGNPASVVNVENYALTTSTGQSVTITGATYNVATRSVTLKFDPIGAANYVLTIGAGLKSIENVALGTEILSHFTTIADLSHQVHIEFGAVRSDRGDGTLTYDVVVTNIGDTPMLAPISLVLDPVQYFQGQPDTPAMPIGSGLWLINLKTTAVGGQLLPGQSTTVQIVRISNPDNQHLSIGNGVFAVPAANGAPVFAFDRRIVETTDGEGSTQYSIVDPVPPAKVGELFSYQLTATDPDGDTVTYLLIEGRKAWRSIRRPGF